MRILLSSNHRYPARDYPASAGGIASARVTDAEVLHLQDIGLEEIEPPLRPWVKSVHVDLKARGRNYLLRDNWIFVSRTLAESYGRNRYVLNGVDPAEHIYSETKRDYFLFICTLDRAVEKG